jgi:glutamyl-tRNA synthetase
LLTGAQGEALSKRLGTLSLRDLRAQGVEPMALLSLMARLGSADPVELRHGHDALIEGFDIARFGAAPTKFDAADLRPLTHRLLATAPLAAVADDVAAAGVPDDLAPAFWDVIRENVDTRADIAPWWTVLREGARPEIDPEDAEFVREALALLPEPPYGPEAWADWTGRVQEATGRKGKKLFMPLRKALTGKARGPEMAAFMPLMQARPKL